MKISNEIISRLIIASSIILTAIIVSNSYNKKFNESKNISVVGMAQIDFESDLIVWEGNYSRKSLNIKNAYSDIKKDQNALIQYFKQQNIPDSEIVFSAVNLTKEFNSTYGSNGELTSNTFSGYSLSQSFKIESKDIKKVERVSRESTELIEKEIELNSVLPRYYYTKLADLKMDLLSKASIDGKNRAQAIAKSVNSKIDKLKKAVMGVFQITGKNSNEDYSYGGSYNTSEKNKTASVTIKMEYILH